MKRLMLILIMLSSTAWAGNPEIETRIKRLESAIALANQEQQSLHTQVQMILEIRRAEREHYDAQMPQAGVSAPPMNYDDRERLRRENEARLRQHNDELSRLYARFRDIEQERQRLREQLTELLTSSN